MKNYNTFINSFEDCDIEETSGPYCPEGRDNFIGVITSINRSNRVGYQDWIINIKDDGGYTAWGICPKELLPFEMNEANIRKIIGNRIRFQATFKPLYGNPYHGQFFNVAKAITHSTFYRD